MAIKIATPKVPTAPTLPPDLVADFVLIQEQFPKVSEKITLMWGAVTLQEYLSKTIFDERGGRKGFPLPIVSALMRIHEYHGTLMPDVKEGDAWGSIVK
jgi:hypothetical protein